MTAPREYNYALTVREVDGGCVATIDGDDSPIRGFGETPILALAQLAECLRDWPVNGAARWLGTSAGESLAKMFCPTWESKPREVAS